MNIKVTHSHNGGPVGHVIDRTIVETIDYNQPTHRTLNTVMSVQSISYDFIDGTRTTWERTEDELTPTNEFEGDDA